MEFKISESKKVCLYGILIMVFIIVGSFLTTPLVIKQFNRDVKNLSKETQDQWFIQYNKEVNKYRVCKSYELFGMDEPKVCYTSDSKIEAISRMFQMNNYEKTGRESNWQPVNINVNTKE